MSQVIIRTDDGKAANELRALGLIQTRETGPINWVLGDLGGWLLTARGKSWVTDRLDETPRALEAARLLFCSVREPNYSMALYYDEPAGLVELPPPDELDMDDEGFQNALDRLQDRKLVAPLTSHKRPYGRDERVCILTALGQRAQKFPEEIEKSLGTSPVPSGGRPGTALGGVSQANFFGPTQIGSHNTQTVTYEIVLHQLIERIRADGTLGEAQKRYWIDILKDIASSTVAKVGVHVATSVLGLR